jgi:hypothetical protein
MPIFWPLHLDFYSCILQSDRLAHPEMDKFWDQASPIDAASIQADIRRHSA